MKSKKEEQANSKKIKQKIKILFLEIFLAIAGILYPLKLLEISFYLVVSEEKGLILHFAIKSFVMIVSQYLVRYFEKIDLSHSLEVLHTKFNKINALSLPKFSFENICNLKNDEMNHFWMNLNFLLISFFMIMINSFDLSIVFLLMIYRVTFNYLLISPDLSFVPFIYEYLYYIFSGLLILSQACDHLIIITLLANLYFKIEDLLIINLEDNKNLVESNDFLMKIIYDLKIRFVLTMEITH